MPSVEFHREAAHIAREVERTLRARHGREANERRRALADTLEYVGAADVGEAVGQFEETVRAIAAGMDYALWDTFMVEVKDLFAEMGVFEQRRTAGALLEAVLVVGDRNSLLGRQCFDVPACRLVRLASIPQGLRERQRDLGICRYGRCLGGGFTANIDTSQIGRSQICRPARAWFRGSLSHGMSSRSNTTQFLAAATCRNAHHLICNPKPTRDRQPSCGFLGRLTFINTNSSASLQRCLKQEVICWARREYRASDTSFEGSHAYRTVP
ncbi:hypothetical protein PMI02_02194 [Novosphingobium sp. AP12]|nr:hypothetical protein PMI02_02194 [Novosphingobium sp. AP12]